MESYFDKQAKYLYNKAEEIINTYAMLKENKKALLNFNLAWATNNNDEDCKKAMNLILKKAIAEN